MEYSNTHHNMRISRKDLEGHTETQSNYVSNADWLSSFLAEMISDIYDYLDNLDSQEVKAIGLEHSRLAIFELKLPNIK